MKKFYSWMTVMAVALSFGFASCSDSDDEPEPEPVAAPELLSFEFKAADNAEVLSADYVGVISAVDKTVKVTMPAFADKSSLVATFTVGEGNTVTVNGVTQQSGVTANDFTAPVDYIVSNSDGSQNLKFTVTVEKAADYVWSEVARLTNPIFGAPMMKINPADNTPYIAYMTKADKKIAVVKYVDGAFVNVGAAEGESGAVTSSRYDFTFNSEGVPYYIYSDGSATDLKSAATVMSFNGSNWVNVGNPGFTGFVPSKTMIGIVGSEIIAPMIVNATKGSFTKREAYAGIYKNGNWSINALSTVGIAMSYGMAMTTTDNAAYIYSVTPTDADKKSFYSVAEYKNGVWTSLRNNYIEPGGIMPPITMSGAFTMAATNDGTVYILTGDASISGNTSDMDMKVLKYSPDSKDWTIVGGGPLTSFRGNDTHITAKLAIAPDGTLFLAYTDYKGDKFAKVQYFDNETKQWSTPEVLSAEKSDDISIGFCDNGEAYISYLGADGYIALLKYAAKK